MGQRDKLEAGLEGLFSTVRKPPDIARENASRSVLLSGGTENVLEMDEEKLTEHPVDEPGILDQHVDQRTDSVQKTGTAVPAEEVQESPPSSAPSTSQNVEVQSDFEPAQPMAHLVIFTLADEYYGVPIGSVERIITMQPITVVPHVPTFIKGLTNLRGTVFPVIDLRERFKLPVTEYTKDTRIMVAEVMNSSKTPYASSDADFSAARSIVVGLLVDAVTEVLQVPGEDIEPPSPLILKSDQGYGEHADSIVGLAKVDGRFIVILDLDKVLAFER